MEKPKKLQQFRANGNTILNTYKKDARELYVITYNIFNKLGRGTNQNN